MNIEEKERDFKGVWIDKEIWLDERLNALEKIIFVEIDSLDNTEEGCYASNEYLAKFCQCTETKISIAVKKLIDLGYLRVIKFDGRHRYLKSNFKYINVSLKENERQTLKKLKADFKKINANNIDNNIDNNSSSSYLYEYIEENFGRTISPIEFEKIQYWKTLYDDEIIKYAVEIAVMNNKKTFNYINAIIRNWKTNSYKTLEEIKQENKIKQEEKLSDELKEYLEELQDYNWFEEGEEDG